MNLNSTCEFLSPPYPVADAMIREYYSSFSLYRNKQWIKPPLNCMVTRLIPAMQIELFTAEHKTWRNHPDRPSFSLYDVQEWTRKGKSYYSHHANLDLPSCWKNISETLNITVEAHDTFSSDLLDKD